MRRTVRCVWLLAALAMMPVLMRSQNRVLVVNGIPGSIPVVQMNGRNYLEVEAFAQMVNASLSFHGNQIALGLPGAANSAAGAPASDAQSTGLSKGFLRAGIEAMSSIREWHSVLASAIENQYPLQQVALTQYQGQATSNVRLMQTAVTTDDDQKAAQFVSNEYQKMKQLTDKYLAKRANMSYISPDALSNDALNQSLMACGKQLSVMAGSGQFSDVDACH